MNFTPLMMNTQAVIHLSKTCLIPCNSYRNRSVLSSYIAVGTCLRLRGQNLSHLHFKKIQFSTYGHLLFPISTKLWVYSSIIALHWILCRYLCGWQNIGGGGGNALLPHVPMVMSYILISKAHSILFRISY